jgi:hypothetical protein
MNAKGIRNALRSERVLMCTYEPGGKVYSLDNGVGVPKRLATELIGQSELQPALFLTANEDGLFPGFSQTWRADR